MDDMKERLRRWRLILGKYSEHQISRDSINLSDLEMDEAMSAIYQKDYFEADFLTKKSKKGGRESSVFNTINWLGKAGHLFPEDIFEKIQSEAIERFGLESFLENPDKAKDLIPQKDLVKTLIAFKGRISSDNVDIIRLLVQSVIIDLTKKLKPVFENAFIGRRKRYSYSPVKNHQNFDYKETIRRNLKNYDTGLKKIIPKDIRFNSRVNRKVTKTIILVVDQSGSMVDSILFSSVIAGVLKGFPNLKVHLILFDTQVADLTDYCDDPVSIIMSVQLGGGTDINKAMEYAESKIEQPQDTIIILITDFFEGGSPSKLVRRIKQIISGGTKLLGVTAMDGNSTPFSDKAMASRLKSIGMDVVSVSPSMLADWLSKELV